MCWIACGGAGMSVNAMAREERVILSLQYAIRLGLARDDGMHRGPVSVPLSVFLAAYARWRYPRETRERLIAY